MPNKGIAFWMPIGAGLGVVFGVVTDTNPGVGVAIGTAIGVAIGTAMNPIATKGDGDEAPHSTDEEPPGTK